MFKATMSLFSALLVVIAIWCGHVVRVMSSDHNDFMNEIHILRNQLNIVTAYMTKAENEIDHLKKVQANDTLIKINLIEQIKLHKEELEHNSIQLEQMTTNNNNTIHCLNKIEQLFIKVQEINKHLNQAHNEIHLLKQYNTVQSSTRESNQHLMSQLNKYFNILEKQLRDHILLTSTRFDDIVNKTGVNDTKLLYNTEKKNIQIWAQMLFDEIDVFKKQVDIDKYEVNNKIQQLNMTKYNDNNIKHDQLMLEIKKNNDYLKYIDERETVLQTELTHLKLYKYQDIDNITVFILNEQFEEYNKQMKGIEKYQLNVEREINHLKKELLDHIVSTQKAVITVSSDIMTATRRIGRTEVNIIESNNELNIIKNYCKSKEPHTVLDSIAGILLP